MKMQINKVIKTTIVILTSMFTIEHVNAEQLFQAKTGQTLTARISTKELTRVQVSGFPIIKAFTTADITVKKDQANGQIYIVPNQDQGSKAFNLYIVDSNGDTFNLNLMPAAHVSGDSIVILPDLAAIRRARAVQASATLNSNSAYSRTINDLIQNMYLGATEDTMQGTSITQSSIEIPMWHKMKVVQVLTYNNQLLVGKVILVTNNTSGKVELRESEFFNTGVLAIAIENPILNVGDTTRVFIINENTAGK